MYQTLKSDSCFYMPKGCKEHHDTQNSVPFHHYLSWKLLITKVQGMAQQILEQMCLGLYRITYIV